MRNVFNVMKNCYRRNWVVIIVSLFLGLLMGFQQKVFGNNFNADFSRMKLCLITKEQNEFSELLTGYLTNQLGMQVIIDSDYKEYTDDLLNRDLSAIIELSDGYFNQCVYEKKALPIQTITIDDYQNEAYLKTYLNTFLQSMDLIFQSANQDIEMAKRLLSEIELLSITVVGADDTIRERSMNTSGFALTAGFYLNFIWIIGIFLGMTILSDRIDGTFQRTQSSPMKGYQYMLGNVLYYLLAGSLLPITFLSILKYQGVDFGFSYWIAALLLFLFQLIVIGISIVMSMLIHSKIGVTIGIYVVGALIAILGGAYFSVEGIGGSMGKIIKLTPTYWFMDCIRSLQSKQEFSPDFHLIVLGLFTALSLTIASVLFSREKHNLN